MNQNILNTNINTNIIVNFESDIYWMLIVKFIVTKAMMIILILMLIAKYLVLYYVNDIKNNHCEGTVSIHIFTNNSRILGIICTLAFIGK